MSTNCKTSKTMPFCQATTCRRVGFGMASTVNINWLHRKMPQTNCLTNGSKASAQDTEAGNIFGVSFCGVASRKALQCLLRKSCAKALEAIASAMIEVIGALQIPNQQSSLTATPTPRNILTKTRYNSSFGFNIVLKVGTYGSCFRHSTPDGIHND